MSRKPNKKHSSTYKGYKPQPVSSSDWEYLAGNPTLLQAFQEFLNACSASQCHS